jgi:hypothetical protein
MANKHRKVWKVISWKPLSEKQTLPNLHKNKSKCYRLILEGFGRDMTELSPSISTTSFTQFTSYPWKKRSWSLQVGCVVPILQTISLPLPKHTGTCLRMSSTPLETQMNKLFHRKRRKLAIRYQLPKEGHASELYREHLIPFNSLYTQKKSTCNSRITASHMILFSSGNTILGREQRNAQSIWYKPKLVE